MLQAIYPAPEKRGRDSNRRRIGLRIGKKLLHISHVEAYKLYHSLGIALLARNQYEYRKRRKK